jgi:RNA polymerase primary sigma factor
MEPQDSIRLSVDELSFDESNMEFVETDREEAEGIAASEEESTYTDDPVRTYLKEMGAISLLTRQGEVDLARRMERGKLRARKVLSRSPLVQQMVLALCANVRRGEVDIRELRRSAEDPEACGN